MSPYRERKTINRRSPRCTITDIFRVKLKFVGIPGKYRFKIIYLSQNIFEKQITFSK